MQQGMESKRYLTLEETAEYINLPLSKIYDLSARDMLPGKVVWGRRTIRVNRAVLDESLNEQTQRLPKEGVGLDAFK